MTETPIMNPNKKNVKVVVFGDIGRSPRMQYHCKSLSELGHKVDVIGYGATEPMDSIKLDPFIFYHYLFPVPVIPIKLLNYVFKTIFQSLNLLFLLLITAKSDILIMQNPPAVPVMAVCWLYCKLVGAKFVIDWHNYAFSIMTLNVGASHPLVKLTKKIEVLFGRKADANFCVTKAMQDDLWANYGIKAITLYDRPPDCFKPITVEEKHEFFLQCSIKYHSLFKINSNETISTIKDGDSVKLRDGRPAILISSTSWTEDEDFSILFKALQDYENHCQTGNTKKLPKLICIITGKGPMKELYLAKIEELKWSYVTVITPWLDSEDYPKILASADLGVSLHTSSSGLDLPMKVVDMFGCGLPVCAFNFNCLNELVKNNQNGFVFKNNSELYEQISNWFEDFPKNERQKKLEEKFKTELEAFQSLRWKENWGLVAAPIFR